MTEHDRREAKYWRSEYENLRRKKKKEIEDLQFKIARFTNKTYELLKLLGLEDEEINNYYKVEGSIKDDMGRNKPNAERVGSMFKDV